MKSAWFHENLCFMINFFVIFCENGFFFRFCNKGVFWQFSQIKNWGLWKGCNIFNPWWIKRSNKQLLQIQTFFMWLRRFWHFAHEKNDKKWFSQIGSFPVIYVSVFIWFSCFVSKLVSICFVLLFSQNPKKFPFTGSIFFKKTCLDHSQALSVFFCCIPYCLKQKIPVILSSSGPIFAHFQNSKNKKWVQCISLGNWLQLYYLILFLSYPFCCGSFVFFWFVCLFLRPLRGRVSATYQEE